MSYYRLYLRRGSPSGPIVGVEEITVADDAEAIRIAALHRAEFVELWQQGRRVAIVPVERKEV